MLAFAGAVPSAEFVVNSTGNDGDASPGDGACETVVGNGICSLRAAVEEANLHAGEDTATIQTTLAITVTGGVGIVISDDLVIRSGHSDKARISGQSVSPIFTVSGSPWPDVSFENLEFLYALSGEVGSAVWVESGGDLHFTGCYFQNNTSILGGAVGVDGECGDILVDTCFFADNPSPGYDPVALGPLNNRGGAIFISGTPIHQRGQLVIQSSDFNSNTALAGGGAIAITNTMWDLVVSDTSFVGNGLDWGSDGDGGAVEIVANPDPLLRSVAHFERVSFTSNINRANSGRGGALAASDALLSLVNCTLAFNSADLGGALSADGGRLALSQTTIKENNASESGGGVHSTGGVELLAAATIFDENTPANCFGSADLSGDFCLSSDASCSFSGSSNQISTATLLGPSAASSGGMVLFDPLPNSPALDSAGAGPCVDALGNEVAVDQAGSPRPADGNADGSAQCDRGARELPVAPELIFVDTFETGGYERWSDHQP